MCSLARVLAVLVVSCASQAFGLQGGERPANPDLPRYALQLNAEEFSLLHSAAASGVASYGGLAKFEVHMERVDGAVAWQVHAEQPRLLETWKYWMAERTTNLLSILDLQTLSAEQRGLLRTCQVLNRKIRSSLLQPSWPLREVEGILALQGDAFLLNSEAAGFALSGVDGEQLAALVGQPVLAYGRNPARNALELERLIPLERDTLEVIVMGQCPYAQAALAEVLQWSEELGERAPALRVSYLFYLEEQDGITTYTSLHGEPEIVENLVQMTLRDHYPESQGVFHRYLRERTKSDDSWEVLVRQAGLGSEDVDSIRSHVSAFRGELVRQEYERMQRHFGPVYGSPSYAWESRLIPDLATVRRLADLRVGEKACTGARSGLDE